MKLSISLDHSHFIASFTQGKNFDVILLLMMNKTSKSKSTINIVLMLFRLYCTFLNQSASIWKTILWFQSHRSKHTTCLRSTKFLLLSWQKLWNRNLPSKSLKQSFLESPNHLILAMAIVNCLRLQPSVCWRPFRKWIAFNIFLAIFEASVTHFINDLLIPESLLNCPSKLISTDKFLCRFTDLLGPCKCNSHTV